MRVKTPIGLERFEVDKTQCFFFYPWKSKVPVKTHFCVFFGFSRVAIIFHGHFLKKFRGNSKFFTATFLYFSRVELKVSRAEIWFFFTGKNFQKGIFFSSAEFYKDLPTFFSNVVCPTNIESTRERNFFRVCYGKVLWLQARLWKIYGKERAFRDSYFNIFNCTFSWFTSKFLLFTRTFPLWLFDGHIIVCTGGMTYFFTTVGLFFTGVILP